MKVLCIAFDSNELSIRLASALAKEVEVCLMLPEEGAKFHLHWLSPDVNFQPFPKPRLRQPAKQISLMFKLIKRIKQFDPDVIHFQKGHLWFNLALTFLRRYPLVMAIHDPRHHMGDKGAYNQPQPIMDYAYRRANRVIAHNEPMKQIIVEELGIPEQIIDIVPLIERGNANAQTEVQEQTNEILFFGRIWAYKGLEYLIRAEPLITAQIPDAKIVIAGKGDDFSSYRRMMVNPENFIVHNEFVSYEKRAKLFRRASIVVLPYVEATQSGVIPVAYTFAKPVIATEVGGLPSQVEHGRTGFLVPPCDEKALADSIIQLLQDNDLRRQLGANGKHKLETEWSAEAVAKKTIPVYRKAINDARSGSAKQKVRQATG
ncbi:MAG: glycosyltransferase family 4 protein [Anaerolineae bacterium]|nr:glycosyltransferase family 4 protein [Anaerolineae bacterium]